MSVRDELVDLVWSVETRDLGGVTQRDAEEIADAILAHFGGEEGFVARAVDGFGIKSITAEDGHIDMKMVANNEDAERIMLATSEAMGMMLETHDAPNYVEFDVAKRGRSKYTVTVRKSVKPTPHQLRQKAEERADKAEATLGRVRDLLDRHKSQDIDVNDVYAALDGTS
ncbi:hypothetical protein O4106_22030 [Rhodococcus pyridinivorans]|uniref:hypothetical protein n=1 Tax=Rhodococcus pyridinivorans TaxID=103816 RepID=UPI0022B46AC5|nr:hypothetical protein [Rhodococcus pyridinivorans]MCZ4649505.1 hypothetical protein [Rhodococcus pyridinivorans]